MRVGGPPYLRRPLMEGELGEEMEFLSRPCFELEVIPGVIAETGTYECRAAVREARKTGMVLTFLYWKATYFTFQHRSVPQTASYR